MNNNQDEEEPGAVYDPYYYESLDDNEMYINSQGRLESRIHDYLELEDHVTIIDKDAFGFISNTVAVFDEPVSLDRVWNHLKIRLTLNKFVNKKKDVIEIDFPLNTPYRHNIVLVTIVLSDTRMSSKYFYLDQGSKLGKTPEVFLKLRRAVHAFFREVHPLLHHLWMAQGPGPGQPLQPLQNDRAAEDVILRQVKDLESADVDTTVRAMIKCQVDDCLFTNPVFLEARCGGGREKSQCCDSPVARAMTDKKNMIQAIVQAEPNVLIALRAKLAHVWQKHTMKLDEEIFIEDLILNSAGPDSIRVRCVLRHPKFTPNLTKPRDISRRYKGQIVQFELYETREFMIVNKVFAAVRLNDDDLDVGDINTRMRYSFSLITRLLANLNTFATSCPIFHHSNLNGIMKPVPEPVELERGSKYI